jgi:diguanylate cyclase (GGDEF)-like protein
LLVEVAGLIRGCCRCTDIPARPEGGEDVLARMGGDEFVILAAGAREGAEDALLSRIQAALRHFNQSSDRPYTLSLSIGFTRCSAAAPHESVDILLAEADRAMYGQKRRGGGVGDESAE